MFIGPLLLAAALASRPPPHEPSTRRGYVQASILVSHHPGNGATYHRVDDRLGGTALTVSAGGGGWISSSIALEGELVYGGLVSAPQQFRYAFTTDYIAQNRDLLLNELVRYRPGGASRIQIVAGGGLGITTARETDRVYTPQTPTLGPGPVPSNDFSTTVYALSFTGGLDAAFPVSSHVALGPSFRVRWVRRPEGGGSGWNGIGPFALQAGVAIQFK